jgi:hypothetical protein
MTQRKIVDHRRKPRQHRRKLNPHISLFGICMSFQLMDKETAADVKAAIGETCIPRSIAQGIFNPVISAATHVQ